MGWWSNAWDNVTGAVSDGLDAVGNGVAQVSANVVSATSSVVNGASNLVGAGDVMDEPEWVEERMETQKAVLNEAWEATTETVSAGWEATKSGASAAWEWTSETAAPAVGNGLEWVVTNVPPPHINIVGWGARLIDPEGDLADKHRRSIEGINGFVEYAYNNPKRAGALVTQGFVNGVTSTVGFVGDGARMIVSGAYDIGRNAVSGTADLIIAGGGGLINGVYSIGQEAGDEPLIDMPELGFVTNSWNEANGNGGFFSTTSSWNEAQGGAFGWSTGLNDWAQIKNLYDEDDPARQYWERIKPEILADMRETITDENGIDIDNPNYMKEIRLGENEERPEYARLIDNPNANYERVLLYGGQAVFEVPAFIGATVFTGGGGTAAWMARYGGRAIQTAATLKRVDTVSDALRYSEKAFRLTEKAARTSRTGRSARLTKKAKNLTTKADKVTTGARAASEGDAVVDLTRRAILGSRAARTPLKQADLVEYMAKYAEKVQKAKTKLEGLVETGAGRFNFIKKFRIARARKGLKSAETKFTKELENVNNLVKSNGNGLQTVAEDVARGATKTKEELSGLQVAREGLQIGARRGWRIADPSRSPIIEGTAVTGSFAFGVYVDKKAAAAELASGVSISKGAADGVMGDTMEKAREMRDNTDWFVHPDDAVPNDTIPNDQGTLRGNLKDNFPESPDGTDGSSLVPLPGGDLNGSNQSGPFNNRAQALAIPLDGETLFTVNVSEEAANEFRQAITRHN